MIRKRSSTFKGQSIEEIDNDINRWMADLRKEYTSVHLHDVQFQKHASYDYYKTVIVHLGPEKNKYGEFGINPSKRLNRTVKF